MQNSSVKITPEFVITANQFIKYVDKRRGCLVNKAYDEFKKNYNEWKEIESRPWYKRLTYVVFFEHAYSRVKDDSFETFKKFHPCLGWDNGYKNAMGIYRETYEVAKIITQPDFWKNSDEAFLDINIYAVINSNGAKNEE